MKPNNFLLALPSHCPIGQLVITINDNELISVGMPVDDIQLSHSNPSNDSQPKDLFSTIAQQLIAYCHSPHNDWSIPISSELGTPFQRRVWHYLQTIPIGTTEYYGEIAAKLGSSARAIGNACRANPLLLIVPCHRVIKRTGIGGFAGEDQGRGVMMKRWLLAHEQKPRS